MKAAMRCSRYTTVGPDGGNSGTTCLFFGIGGVLGEGTGSWRISEISKTLLEPGELSSERFKTSCVERRDVSSVRDVKPF